VKKSEIIIKQILIDIYYIIIDLSSNFDQSWKKKEEDRKVSTFIAHTSALEMTQLSNVLITDNLF
jgi:hypothetical protein